MDAENQITHFKFFAQDGNKNEVNEMALLRNMHRIIFHNVDKPLVKLHSAKILNNN